MKQVKLKKFGVFTTATIKLWEDIDEAPVDNYNLMNEYSMLDMEIGDSPEAGFKRLERMSMFFAHKKYAEAEQEHRNLYQTFHNMATRVNFKSLQFAVMIHSIDDVEIKDYSQNNLQVIVSDLSKKGLTMGMVKEAIDSIKKKLLHN